MNYMMVDFIRKTPFKKTTLPKKLGTILKDGFINKNNCLFFRYFYNANQHLTEKQFEDKTEYESCINDFHFEDYYRNSTINHVFLFVNKFKELVEELNYSSTIEIIVSSDNGDISFTFVTLHNGEKHWIELEKIDCFKQPLMIIEL